MSAKCQEQTLSSPWFAIKQYTCDRVVPPDFELTGLDTFIDNPSKMGNV